MSTEHRISYADLSAIENSLRSLDIRLDENNANISIIKKDVQKLNQDLIKLHNDIAEFISYQANQNRLGRAETRIVQIRQEIEKKFGHYDFVRRTIRGVLQANDMGVIREETIKTATEEVMLSTPNYWLAPALVALSSWICNNQELANKAMLEAIRLDNEKTSLLFTLICRRSGRKSASLKWAYRYLAAQDEEAIDRKTMIILDCFSNGLLGADSESRISSILNSWIARLSEKPGFVDKQRQQWVKALSGHLQQVDDNTYAYLATYSPTWDILKNLLSYAALNNTLFYYFKDILEQPVDSEGLVAELDIVLQSLVENFDEEEKPLRKEERLEVLVKEQNGDEAAAKTLFKQEESTLEEKIDFTKLLTNAVLYPDLVNASISTQKIALALSKGWIIDAYRDMVVNYRMTVPLQIELKIKDYTAQTSDGANESEVIKEFLVYADREEARDLEALADPEGEENRIKVFWIVAGLGVLGCFANPFIGIPVVLIFGIWAFSKQKARAERAERRVELGREYVEFRNNGTEVIRNFMAEVVDYRDEFLTRDQESETVIDLVQAVTTSQYIKHQPDEITRNIKV